MKSSFRRYRIIALASAPVIMKTLIGALTVGTILASQLWPQTLSIWGSPSPMIQIGYA